MTGIICVHTAAGRRSCRRNRLTLRRPGPGEPRVRHTAIGISYIDVYHRSGLCAPTLPFIPGVEGAGVVAAFGPGARVSIAVIVAYATLPGSYAEVRLVPLRVLGRAERAVSRSAGS